MMPNYLGRCGVLATAMLLFFPYLLHSQPPWRSQLYPINWEPPTSTPFTQRMLQDWSYAGAFEGQAASAQDGTRL